MQAAIGVAQLKKLPEFVKRRQHNWKRLNEALQPIKEKVILPRALSDTEPSWFGFLLTCKVGTRKRIVERIEDKGIQTRMLFAGNILKHPCFEQMRKEKKGFRVIGDLPNTDQIMNDTFWVGVYPGMTDGMIDYMAEVIIEAVMQ